MRLRGLVPLVCVVGVLAAPPSRAAAADPPVPPLGFVASEDTTARPVMPSPLNLRAAVHREAVRSAGLLGRTPLNAAQPSANSRARQPWIRRHPVLFGALIGAAAGTLSAMPRWTELYCAFGGDEDCLFHGSGGVGFGAAAGAGIGALIGVVAR